jgi:hypothetical protein
MSFLSEPDPNKEKRPWWTGSRPKWRSPWSFDEEEDSASEPMPKAEDLRPRSEAAVDQSVSPRQVSEREKAVVAKERPKESLVVKVITGVEQEKAAGLRLDEVQDEQEPVNVSKVQVPLIERAPVEAPEVKARPVQEVESIEPEDEDEEEESEEDAEEVDPSAEAIRNQYRRNRRRRRGSHRRVGTSWTSVVLMAMAVLSLTFLAWLYVTDEGEIEDKDLMIAAAADLTPTVTAPGRLAAFLGSVTTVPKSEMNGRAAWEWDTATMVNWLVENSQALDNLKDLLEDFDWRGRHASWHFADLGNHEKWQAAMTLKQVEASYLQRDGKHEAAISAALDLAELARRLQDIQAWPSFYFRSLETHRRCTDLLAELLQRTQASEEALSSFQKQFEACEPSDDHVRRNVLPGFYLYEKKRLMGIESGEPFDTMPAGVQRPLPKQLFFKTNETLGIMANTIRHLVRQVGQPNTGGTALREVWEGVSGSREVAVYQPNGRGVAYARRELEPYLDVPARQQLARTRHLLVVELFAMRRFIAKEKGLPHDLGLLIPNYLKNRLTDPFSGEAFHYDAVRGLIYSVGTDLKSSGGRANLAPLTDPGEPTVRIGVQKASAN